MVYSLVLPNSIGKQQFFASIIPAFLDPAWERSITFSNTNMCQIPFMMTAAVAVPSLSVWVQGQVLVVSQKPTEGVAIATPTDFGTL